MNFRKVICILAFILCAPTIKTSDINYSAYEGIFKNVAFINKSASIEAANIIEVGSSIEEIEEPLHRLGTHGDVIVDICNLPRYSGFKSYEPYLAISRKDSKQYKLQQLCYTEEGTGLRKYEDRYCVAVGTGVGVTTGDYIRLVLTDGEEINCVVADIKDNKHTDSSNLITVATDCASEFLVEQKYMSAYVKKQGDVSYYYEWAEPVDYILIEEGNVFEEISD